MKKLWYNDWVWWKHGVIYHIYPRSFYDSNGDGIGDLNGILEKLPYIQQLGVDAIWLSPVFMSPQVDCGYDVSDYTNIDPIFGNLQDFENLLHAAHRKKIRVILDLVLNHTSDQHPWFIESALSKNNPKRNWYIWQDGKNGKSPNNWKTSFGNKAWKYHKATGQYYYHSFFVEQPDLNWRNKSMKKEFFSMVEFWLDKGVDGFRLDVANFIVKDKKLRNNPGLIDLLFRKNKIYTRNRPKSIRILRKFRELLNKYPSRMSVGEIYTLPPGNPDLSRKYLGKDNDALHLAFDFSLMFKKWDARVYAQTIDKWINGFPKGGWPTHVLSNHDLLRHYNRPKWKTHKHEKAVVAAFLLLTLKGTPFIYYGEEIGLPNQRIPRKFITDKLGKLYWPFYAGRDRSRTPMPWDNTQYAGFSKVQPWLPVNKNYTSVNVQNQENDEGSLLYFYRKLIELRKKHPALFKGEWSLLSAKKNGTLAYIRYLDYENIIVLLNFRNRTNTVFLDQTFNARVLLSTHKKPKMVVSLDSVLLTKFEATILHIKN